MTESMEYLFISLEIKECLKQKKYIDKDLKVFNNKF